MQPFSTCSISLPNTGILDPFARSRRVERFCTTVLSVRLLKQSAPSAISASTAAASSVASVMPREMISTSNSLSFASNCAICETEFASDSV